MSRLIHCRILAFIAVFTVADCTRADMLALPGSQIDVNLRFKNLEEYPQYDFYVKYGGSFRSGGPFTPLVKVNLGTPTNVARRRGGLGSVFLVAVPRGQAIEVPAKFDEDWQRKAPAGGLQSPPLSADASGTDLGSYSGYDITYQVRIADGKLEVEWVETNLNAEWSTLRLIAIVVGAVCLLVPIVVVVFLVLLVRSRKRLAAPDPGAAP